MTRAWDRSSQQGTALLLLLALADFANDEGTCWPSVKTLARKCRLGKRQTQNLLGKLEEEGEISRLDMGGGRGNTTTYRVNYVAPFDDERVQSSTERVQSGAERVQSSAEKGAIAIAPEPSLTVINRQEGGAPDGAEPPPEFVEILAAFVEITELKAPDLTKRNSGTIWTRWVEPLQRIGAATVWETARAEYAIRQAVEAMDRDGLTVSSPKSVVESALSVIAREQRGPASGKDSDQFLEELRSGKFRT